MDSAALAIVLMRLLGREGKEKIFPANDTDFVCRGVLTNLTSSRVPDGVKWQNRLIRWPIILVAFGLRMSARLSLSQQRLEVRDHTAPRPHREGNKA